MQAETFIKEIQDTLSVDCQVPIKLPEKSILRVMRRAFTWFHRNYSDAVHDALVALPIAENHKEIMKNRSLKLPKCIISVINAKKSSQLNLFADNPEYSITRWRYDTSGIGYINGDALTYKVMEQFYLDFSKTILVPTTSWDFNRNTNEFYFTGEIPDKALLLEVLEAIPDGDLMEDELFFDYVLGKTMMDFSRIVRIFKVPLPNSQEPDFSAIYDIGKEYVDTVIQTIKDEDTHDFIFVQNTM